MYDVVGIGNALVDVLVAIDDDGFLEKSGMAKGGMALVDSDQSDTLYAALPAGVECSGGSVGNTMAGFAALGGKGAYIGKVKDDSFGKVFRHDMQAIGVDFNTPVAEDGPGTGRCLVMVSSDAQRTMATYLGAAVNLAPGDVDEKTVKNAAVTYLEGYLFDPEDAKKAFVKAADLAHAAGNRVALSLSDPFCVDRHRDAFLRLVDDHIDILFANETEIMSLYRTDSFDAALQKVLGHCEIACLTRSEKGCVILRGDEMHIIDAEPLDGKLTDTTGAGDQFAAGFLWAFTRGDLDLAACGRVASIAAAEIIIHYGARPEADVRVIVKDRLGV
ncbi:MAG: adenosine kinase [Alphaproteobacteria bacterium]